METIFKEYYKTLIYSRIKINQNDGSVCALRLLTLKQTIMKNTRKTLSIALVSILSAGFITSCNKYEDGPTVSLLSKKARMENTWAIENAYRNGENVTEDYDQYTLKMTKNGDANLTATYTAGSFSYQYETQGTWTFKDDKESVMLDFQDDDADQLYQILKLEDDALWLREIGGEDELHLKTK